MKSARRVCWQGLSIVICQKSRQEATERKRTSSPCAAAAASSSDLSLSRAYPCTFGRHSERRGLGGTYPRSGRVMRLKCIKPDSYFRAACLYHCMRRTHTWWHFPWCRRLRSRDKLSSGKPARSTHRTDPNLLANACSSLAASCAQPHFGIEILKLLRCIN